MRNQTLPLLIALMLGAGALGFGIYQVLGNDEDTEEPLPEAAEEARDQAAAQDLAATLPEFSMPDVDGEERDIGEWQDDILVINFWGTWCAPCREEVPLLIDIQEEYADQNLTVLGIALDEPDAVREFAEEFGINYPLLVGENETLEVMEQFGSGNLGMPHTFVTDRDGNVVNFHMGLIEPEDVDGLLAPAFDAEDS